MLSQLLLQPIRRSLSLTAQPACKQPPDDLLIGGYAVLTQVIVPEAVCEQRPAGLIIHPIKDSYDHVFSFMTTVALTLHLSDVDGHVVGQ